MNLRPPVSYQLALWALIFLFSLRVIGQLIQTFFSSGYLPEIDQWQGSNLPYWLLLAVQILLIGLMVFFARLYSTGEVIASRFKGHLLLGMGIIYLLVMLSRLIVGLMDVSELSWFQKPIPALFHLVLASFMILLGLYHIGLITKRGKYGGN